MVESVILRVAKAQQQSDAGLGRARLDMKTRKELGVEIGDAVEVTGKKLTVAKVLRAVQEDEGKGIIRIDGMTRANAGVSIGERVTVGRADFPQAGKVVLAPKIPTGKRITFGAGIDDLFRKGLTGRPVIKGDEIIVPNFAVGGNFYSWMVISTQPTGGVVVADHTEVVVKAEPTEVTDAFSPSVTYDDIGGLEHVLQRIREMIELPLKHPELFDRLGIDAPKGVLLYGPSGTGKTLLAKAVASESGAAFYSIQGPEIMSKYYGQSEEKLREKFDEAAKNAPSIIFIDEIDSIAPKREDVSGEVERRVVAQLLTLMDGLSERGQVIVIGATNRQDSMDPALRRPGRFDREIEVGVPSFQGRKEILQIHTRGMPLGEDVNLDHYANYTHGFTGADLAALAREAAMKCLARFMPALDLDKSIPVDILMLMKVTAYDFDDALKEVEPSALREVLVEMSNVGWSDVGGLEEAKQQLREMVEMPIEKADAFKRLGIRPSRGVMLYGPPGTGKTLLAKAVANESKANFISIKGPEIMSKWLGESEKAIREAFKKARQVAPTIIFLDEIDAIAPRRGWSEGSNVTERVVNQLLTSMDGLASREGVTVIAATNRPDIVDNALLRPGRFDRLILVPVPDANSRKAILGVHTRNMPIKDLDMESLVARTDGFVGADLENLCREAAMAALRLDENTQLVEMQHFETALKNVKPSVDKESARQYDQMGKNLHKARAGMNDLGIFR
ncbi:MAG TPA: CDC48 family AAA ATPase [Methanomassiliicoccales archaeon]|nr:CDC48 family AAA ATPase [Methanomassiliicoccales archaeon]